MSATATQSSTWFTQLLDRVDYTQNGVSSQLLVQDDRSQYQLICVQANTQIPEHSVPRSVTLTVLEGRGILTVEEHQVTLEPGVFIYLPSRVSHSLYAAENLALLHTRSSGK
jgi:quercetin dioxygenase-like cupin family protein